MRDLDPRLHEYQRAAVEHLWERPRAALFLKPGLGKTAVVLQSLTASQLPALVVAPKRVAEQTWPVEAATWRPDLRVSVVAGSPAKRRAALAADADVYVIGQACIGDVVGRSWRTVVLDELHGYKDRGTARWKAARKLTASRGTRVVGLTGTPSPNSLLDLWGQLFLLDQGERLGSGVSAYRERYFTPGRQLASGVVTEWLLRPGADAAIHRKVSDICLSLDAVEHLDLPDVIVNRVRLAMPPKAVKTYEGLKRDLVADAALLEGATVSAANAAVLTGKLSQLAAGFLYADRDDPDAPPEPVWLHTVKVDAVRDIVAEDGAPVLVWYRFAAERDALLAGVPGARDVREPGAVEAWNRGAVPVLLAHPASAGAGLNLQHSGGSAMVWVTLPWSSSDWEQACARLVRQGQRSSHVVIHVLEAADIDSAIRVKLERKASTQAALMEYLVSSRVAR